jgi:hypothetical protein
MEPRAHSLTASYSSTPDRASFHGMKKDGYGRVTAIGCYQYIRYIKPLRHPKVKMRGGSSPAISSRTSRLEDRRARPLAPGQADQARLITLRPSPSQGSRRAGGSVPGSASRNVEEMTPVRSGLHELPAKGGFRGYQVASGLF